MLDCNKVFFILTVICLIFSCKDEKKENNLKAYQAAAKYLDKSGLEDYIGAKLKPWEIGDENDLDSVVFVNAEEHVTKTLNIMKVNNEAISYTNGRIIGDDFRGELAKSNLFRKKILENDEQALEKAFHEKEYYIIMFNSPKSHISVYVNTNFEVLNPPLDTAEISAYIKKFHQGDKIDPSEIFGK